MKKTFDRNNVEIKIGDKVIWYDPAIDARDLSRVWTIDKITDEIVYISDDFSESEVFANELSKKNQNFTIFNKINLVNPK